MGFLTGQELRHCARLAATRVVRVLACGRPPLSFPPTCCLPRHNYSSWRQLFNDKVSVRASAAARGDCCSSVGIDQVVSVGGAVLATALLTRSLQTLSKQPFLLGYWRALISGWKSENPVTSLEPNTASFQREQRFFARFSF